MKKILGITLFLFLFVASNCFAAVTFRWIEVISDTRDSEWRFSTDFLLDQPYSPSYEASFSVDGGPPQSMNYLYFGTDVYDSGVIGTPLDYFGKTFSWNVTDISDSSAISATAAVPLQGMRQVAISMDIAISGDLVHPTVSWTNPEGSSTALINNYRLRVVDAIDPTKLYWQTDIPTAQNVEYTINGFSFQPGVGYSIRIEARQYFFFPVTGNGFGPNFPRFWDPGQQKYVPVAALLNRSTVFLNHGIPFPIEIDIKPGSDPNSINLKSKGVVPVAVLTTDDFDALSIDPYTVFFADAPAAHWTMCDFDYDGDLDMLFHFRTQDLNLDESSTEGSLSCYSEGKLFGGSDSVRIVPAPKKK